MPDGNLHLQKIMRAQKACDECNKRKTKCSGGSATIPCDKCKEFKRNCTFSLPAKKRGPSTGYVNSLVDTIETLKAKLDDKIALPADVPMHSATADTPPSATGSFDSGMMDTDWSQSLSAVQPSVQWTHDTFRLATLLGPNGPAPWYEIYYEFVHPQWSFLYEHWFLTHFNSFPLILLHAMYAASTFYSLSPQEEGEFHFSACKAVMDDAIENPDPFKAAAVMLLAVYSVNSKRLKSAIVYLCLAIRFCQILGIDKDKYLIWKNTSGPLPGLEQESPKLFCRCLWSCLYAHDFFAIFLIGVPGSVTLDIDTSYLLEYRTTDFSKPESTPQSFLCFCSYYMPLLVISRKALRLTGESEAVVVSRNALLARIEEWRQSVYHFDFNPSRNEAYMTMFDMPFMYLIYHFVRLQLVKYSLLDAFRQKKFDSPLLEDATNSASEILGSIRAYLTHNPELKHLALLMKYCVMFSGAFHCTLLHFDATQKSRRLSEIREHVKFLEIFGTHYPQSLLDAKTVEGWTAEGNTEAIDFLEKSF